MDTTGELEEHKQQVKIQLDTRLKALTKIKKELHCRIAIIMSKKAINVTPQPQSFTTGFCRSACILHKLLCLGIKVYIYYKECVALIYINIILYQIGRRKGIKRRKIKRDKVGRRAS